MNLLYTLWRVNAFSYEKNSLWLEKYTFELVFDEILNNTMYN